MKINHDDCIVDLIRVPTPSHDLSRGYAGTRITHKPSGIISESVPERSQFANRQNALRILEEKLKECL